MRLVDWTRSRREVEELLNQVARGAESDLDRVAPEPSPSGPHVHELLRTRPTWRACVSGYNTAVRELLSTRETWHLSVVSDTATNWMVLGEWSQ